MSQINNIKMHLETGATLTPLEAWRMFGTLRLAAHIFVLRRRGLGIETRLIAGVTSKGDDAEYAEYRLAV